MKAYWGVEVAQDKYQWWALLNMVMNLTVPYEAGSFLTK
jgi:hypothetical protein